MSRPPEAMIVSVQPDASEAVVKVPMRGGNAVDEAIAAERHRASSPLSPHAPRDAKRPGPSGL